jgi:hypothetical protein
VERRNGGAPFDENKWVYRMERWERGGVQVDSHYFEGTFDDDPFTTRYFHHH